MVDQICLAVPVLPNRADGAIAFMKELETSRRSEYEASERRIGITKEVWFLARGANGDQLLAYMESPAFAQALAQFAQSQDAFDQWFKQRLAAVTGVDLNNPPSGPLSELLSSYEAEAAQASA